MTVRLRTWASGVILVGILFGWMSVDWGHNGCDPTPDITSVR